MLVVFRNININKDAGVFVKTHVELFDVALQSARSTFTIFN